MAKSKYIYEMVVFRPYGAVKIEGFFTDYRFEDFFLSKRAAVAWLDGFVSWLRSSGAASEVLPFEWVNHFGFQFVKYRVLSGNDYEYYGIVRHRILS